MKKKIGSWSLKGREKQFAEPGTAMFLQLRRRLTLWYSAILGTALLLAGTAIYIGTEQMLLYPVQNNLVERADALKEQWMADPANGCAVAIAGDSQEVTSTQADAPEVEKLLESGTIVFWDREGHGTIRVVSTGNCIPGAGYTLGSPLEKLIENAGYIKSESNQVAYVGKEGEQYLQYQEAVPGPAGQEPLGIVQVSEFVQERLNALNVLLILLVAVGILAMGCASFGGFWMADRALAPARLAFKRQQEFIADASHELRTPLALLRADAEVLLRGRERLRDDDVELLEDIVSESAHMSTLANNMLMLARLDAGQMRMEHDVINLADVAETITRRAQAYADLANVKLIVEHPERDDNPTLPLVIGDQTLLEQATLILVENAIKYNRSSGNVTIRASVAEGKARLEVQDTGVGIEPEHLPHLGERFYRVEKARTREAGGSGLGLSIARGIAQAHKGTLTITSTIDQGTTAILILPPAFPAI